MTRYWIVKYKTNSGGIRHRLVRAPDVEAAGRLAVLAFEGLDFDQIISIEEE